MRRRRIWIVSTVVAVAAVAVLVSWSSSRSRRPEATIDDAEFVRRANAICARDVPSLRAPERRATSTTALRPQTLRSVADGIDRVAGQLRTVPVEADDAARVDAWLDDWERYTAVGRRYADAVERDDPDEYSKVDDEAVVLASRIGRFARGNRIDDCVL